MLEKHQTNTQLNQDAIRSERLPSVLSAAALYHVLLDARLPLDQWPTEVVALDRYARTAHRPVIVLADLKRRDASS